VSSPPVDAAPVSAVPGQDDLAPEDAIVEAPAVLRILWADPQHMAEHLAVWSLARFGPRAGSAVDKLRARQPDAGREDLEESVVARQTRVAMTEGAFVGGPFIVLIPIAFCAALLAQAQMVFELAAVHGRNPNDQLRAAELLVLLGAYPSTEEASAAMAALPRDPKQREGKRLPRGSRIDMVKRMAYLLEVLGPADTTRTRLRATLGWVGVGALFLVGLALPLVWVPYMAYTSRRATLRMGARARSYYAAVDAGETGLTVRRKGRVQVGGTAAFARMALLIVLPVLVALVGLLTGFNSAGGRWLTAVLLLIGISVLATLAWFGYRWWRYSRRRSSTGDDLR
jgi:hypothetical protein